MNFLHQIRNNHGFLLLVRTQVAAGSLTGKLSQLFVSNVGVVFTASSHQNVIVCGGYRCGVLFAFSSWKRSIGI